MKRLLLVAVGLAVVCGAGCRSTRGSQDPPRPLEDFRPAKYLSTIHLEDGRNASLFSPESYAIWVSPEVAMTKRNLARASGETIEEPQGSDLITVTENFIVIECHVESVFADASIAYDVVGLRQVDAYLELPNGDRIAPIQVIIGSPVEEEQREALTLFRRTNFVVFPRRDLWVGRPTVEQGFAYARLVLTGFSSKFYFEWPQAPSLDSWRWVPTPEEVEKFAVVGYMQLSRELYRLGKRFQ